MTEPNKPAGEIILYQTEDGRTKLEVRLQDETVWLTQQQLAALLQTSKQNISLHIQNIYEEGELAPEATVKKFLTVRTESRQRAAHRLADTGNTLQEATILNAAFAYEKSTNWSDPL